MSGVDGCCVGGYGGGRCGRVNTVVGPGWGCTARGGCGGVVVVDVVLVVVVVDVEVVVIVIFFVLDYSSCQWSLV